jgi:CRISPR-associated endonuclease/helicase Cas3
MNGFEALFRAATSSELNPDGVAPYPYQARLAAEGLPELLEVPTGMGKTLAVTTAWLYRRRFHPDEAVRASTPRRLVFVLPMRVLVEQTCQVIASVLDRLGLAVDVPLRVLMGGEPMTGKHDWRLDFGDSIVVGTVDMVVSRCLNRGYGESRYLWPIDFGLLHADSQFVFDETQLMGPALPTTRQLHGLRQLLGEAAPSRSTWMSATVDESALATVDCPTVGDHVTLSAADLNEPAVVRRIRADKAVAELVASDDKGGLAQQILQLHRPGTLTLAILNTVDRAVEMHKAIAKLTPDADLVLLHSRFRPSDRARQVELATRVPRVDGPGLIVVSTQVVEAGVDISAATLVTEVAPWPSLVQRAGRCNRSGDIDAAALYWIRVPTERSAPYEVDDIAAATKALETLSGATVHSEMLGTLEVPVRQQIHTVLRRRDLLELFDTLPDVSGNDIDISRFVREADDLDVAVAWRRGITDGASLDEPMPGRDERCPVPVRAIRDWIKKRGHALRWNHLSREWERCGADQVRPGMVLLVDSEAGGYAPTTGWSPESRVAVQPVSGTPGPDDAATADDPISVSANWVVLHQHLEDARRELEWIMDNVSSGGLGDGHRAAAVDAARLHDIGKAHDVFRESVSKVAEKAHVKLPPEQVFAKTGVQGVPLRHGRPNFRHELASALCLLGEGGAVLQSRPEADLTVYLVAAHHGRVRMGIRSLPGDTQTGQLCALGIVQGDRVPAVMLTDGELPASTLDLGVMALGGGAAGRSWSARALELRDRPDVGPFRLAFLEAVVRLADWRASESPTTHELKGG